MLSRMIRQSILFAILVTCSAIAQNKGELVVQTEMYSDIRKIAISSNGNILANAGGNSKDLRIWDIRTGKMIQHYTGMKDIIADIALSRDGRYTAALELTNPHKVTIWDNIAGKKLAEMNNESSPMAFSSDGSLFFALRKAYSTADWHERGESPEGIYISQLQAHLSASSSYANKSYLFKSKDNATLKTVTTPFQLSVDGIFASNDGTIIAIYDQQNPEFDSNNLDQVSERIIKVFQTSDGTLLYEQRLLSKEIGAMDLSSNGEYLATSSGDTVSISSLGSKKILQTIVLDRKSELRGKYYGLAVKTLAFTPDNTQLAVESGTVIKIYDCRNGALVRTLKGSSVQTAAQFAPSGESIIAGGNDGLIRRIDLKNGISITPLNSFGFLVSDIAFHPGGSTFAVRGGRLLNDNDDSVTIRFYNFPFGKEVGRLPVPSYAYDKMFFTPDGKKIVTTTTGGLKFASFGDFSNKKNSIEYSKEENAVKVFDAVTMKELYTIPGMTESGFSKNTSALPMADHSSIIVTRSKNELYSLANGTLKSTIPSSGVTTTPDGKYLLSVKSEFLMNEMSTNYYLQLIDISSGQVAKSILYGKEQPYIFRFSPNGKILAISSFANTTTLFEYPTMAQTALFVGIQGTLSFRNDSKMLIVSGSKLSFINTQTKSVTVSMVFVGEKDFIVSTPDNYYMATKGALNGVAFRVGLNGYPFEQYDLKYNRPDIVLERLGYTSNAMLVAMRGLHDTRMKKMGFDAASMKDDFHLPEAGFAPTFTITEVQQNSLADRMGLKVDDNIISINEHCFLSSEKLLEYVKPNQKYLVVAQRDEFIEGLEFTTFKQEEQFGFKVSPKQKHIPFKTLHNAVTFPFFAHDSLYTLDRINVYVNDVPVYGIKGISLRANNLHYYTQPITVQLARGKNKIQVSVINSIGTESLKETFDITNDTTPVLPNLYLVSVGISKYEDVDTDRDWTLDYSAKDAEDIAAMFERGKGTIYQNVDKTIVTNSSATKEMILSLKDELQSTSIDDQVVLFFSGHGLYDEQSKQYYLSTSDVDFENPSHSAIRYEDFENLLDGIPARNKMILIDACNSGEQEIGILETTSASNTAGITVKSKGFTAKKKSPKSKTKGMKNTGGTLNSDSKYLRLFMQQMFAELRRGTGATIISSSTGVQSSLESSEWNNGAFTFATREGIEHFKADRDSNQVINVSELRDYIFRRVEELTKGAQTPTSRRENLENDFRVW
ncbi:MAG: caspase family protein [Bacteroidota bacterium]